jgi:hypothetical protein
LVVYQSVVRVLVKKLPVFEENGFQKQKKALFSIEMFPKTGLFCTAFL